MAMLVALETLTPLERTVFVLHEVFGYDHPEIAAILGRSPAAVRQTAHRAHEHGQARRPRYQPDPSARRLPPSGLPRRSAVTCTRCWTCLPRTDVVDRRWWQAAGGAAGPPRPRQGRAPAGHGLRQAPHGRPGHRLRGGERRTGGAAGCWRRAVGVLLVDSSEQDDWVNAIYSEVNHNKLTWLAGALRERPSAQPHDGAGRAWTGY
jgi:Sigma-70, region 4